jgi:hypothetical protein
MCVCWMDPDWDSSGSGVRVLHLTRYSPRVNEMRQSQAVTRTQMGMEVI